MHLIMILVAIGLAWYLRLRWTYPKGNWTKRWQRSLLLFLFPPLLLITTALAVLCMGTGGQMVGVWDGWFSYSLAVSFLGFAAILCIKLGREGSRTLEKIRSYPQIDIGGKPARVINTPALFTAQIGFWQPELVVSEHILQTFDSAHLEAVLAHEQAHYHYRDTFWFFWLGWVRQTTAWLPNTDALWKELLTLRELRADAKAAQQVDYLLLAEALLLVVSYPHFPSEIFCAAFSATAPPNRLTQRIDALLAQPELPSQPNWWFWTWLLLAFLPLAAVPFHT